MKNVSIKKYVEDLVDGGISRVWPYYSKDLVNCALSDIERVEFAGRLLADHIGQCPQDIGNTIVEIAEQDDFFLADLIADYCQDDSDLKGDRLLQQIKKAMVIQFADKMQNLLDDEISDRLAAKYEDNGCVRTMDMQTGEMTWVRR